ncbi:RING/U-box protein, putative isoform 1 [Hibiscus syriacus]|uniref:1-phosphatidylinositol 4-kinase n=1 Tax=Hibiscus syriacus TaxID=106335 RepID=A0A6A2X3Z4_HIBSY|nr:RING/U-box protein, putative isoform 1 [Hibiscus syriacus]
MNGNKFQNTKKVSKIASLQQLIPHDFDASDQGSSSFPVDAIHRIGILDVRFLNTDRHGGNLLVRKLGGVGGFGKVELIPIDHGLCLPESLEDPHFHIQREEPSELEVICLEAKELEREIDLSFFEADERDLEFQFDMDSQVDEIVEESEIRVDEDWFHTASRLSPSLKKVNLGEKGFHYHGGKPEGNYTMGYSYLSRISRSANEQLPKSITLVKFVDLNEDEWNVFIVKFKELLYLLLPIAGLEQLDKDKGLGLRASFVLVNYPVNVYLQGSEFKQSYIQISQANERSHQGYIFNCYVLFLGISSSWTEACNDVIQYSNYKLSFFLTSIVCGCQVELVDSLV